MILIADESLSLELLQEQHAEAMIGLIDSNRPHLAQWLTWLDNIRTIEHFRNFIADAQGRIAAGSDFPYVILLNGSIAGRIGIYNIDPLNRIGSIGYWLGEHYQGQGIVTRACKALITHCFDHIGLNRIEIKCGVGNHKSQAVPERLQFRKEGIIRQGELVNNRFIDLYSYSLLKEEWQP